VAAGNETGSATRVHAHILAFKDAGGFTLDNLGPHLIIAVFSGLSGLVVIWLVWNAWITPPGDIPRIRRTLEGEARCVVQIKRDGSYWTIRTRAKGGMPTIYRKYQVVLERPDRSRKVMIVGLEPRIFVDSIVYECRRGDWYSLHDNV
jgi:hypothetical protein